MSASDYMEISSDWKEQLLKILALWLRRPHNPATTLLKCMCVLFPSAGHIFFLHFGHHNIAFKSSLGVSAWFGYNISRHVWRKYVRLWALLNSQHCPTRHLFCYPVWREEEPGVAFKEPRQRTLPLLEWTRRGWDQLTPGSSKSRLPLFSPHLCISLPDQPQSDPWNWSHRTNR